LIAPYGLMAAAALGYGWRFGYLARHWRWVGLTLLLICVLMFLAYVRWLMLFIFLTGRLMLPGYLAFCLLLTIGIAYGYDQRIARLLRLMFAGLVMFIGLVIVAGVTLPRAFIRATFAPEQLPQLSGSPVSFGEAQLAGYRIDQSVLDGSPIDVTLCWRSLRRDGRLPVPYAFGFNLVDENNTIYAGRESYPGLGKYTLWYPNRAFCDHFTLPMEREPVPAHAYRVTVGLFDPATMQPIQPDNNASPFLGWIAAPGPALTQAERQRAHYRFEDVYLLDYTFEASVDGLSLETQWGTGRRAVRRPLTLFMHLVDADENIVAQLDTPLGGEVYPSWLWGDNENTFSGEYSLNLPSDLPTGSYAVYMGLYDSETLARLAVTDTRGKAQPDNRVLLTNEG